MSVHDFSGILQSMLVDETTTSAKSIALLQQWRQSFRLVDVPLVYHVLPNQGSGARRPSMTNDQREQATTSTTKLFEIYDKGSKESVQFVSFVTNETVVHNDFNTTKDCISLSPSEIGSIVKRATDWQFKMHVIVCEFKQVSGVATLPLQFRATHPSHNLLRVDHRTMACFDDEGKFLCDLTNGQQVSHNRWWRTRSVSIAHELGHLFGLVHTFSGGCISLDRIPDTPPESGRTPRGCPGLLPYDKDRNLFRSADRLSFNGGADSNTCHSRVSEDICGTTCAACCQPDQGSKSCSFDLPSGESITEEMVASPVCCNDTKPINTCRLRRGIDPLNNVMSYSPDFCTYEFTPGQMARMMAQTRKFKPYIYCNFADRIDNDRCRNIPCFSGATSPNCR